MRLVTVQQTIQKSSKIAAFGTAVVLLFSLLSPLAPLSQPAQATDDIGPNLTINYLSGTDKTGGWADSTPASIGETVEFYLEIHNTNVPSTAENLTVRVNLPSTPAGGTIASTAYASTTTPSTVPGSQTSVSDSTSIISLPNNARLQYQPNSMKITWDKNGDGVKEYDNYVWPNDNLVSGSGINLGNLLGCNPYIIQISFKAALTKVPEPPEISIEKKVVWNGREYDSIDKAVHLYDPDESVVYKIYVKNNGETAAIGVKVVDYLPTYIRTLDGADKKEFNIGTLGVGELWLGEYPAKVLSDLPQNDRTQENRAKVTADNADSDEDSAFVWINGPEILAAEVAAAVSAAPAELPATGPAVPVALGLSGLLSLGVYLRRRLV